MAILNLASLVLAGSVRSDVSADLRLGTSTAKMRASGNCNSMQHSLPRVEPVPPQGIVNPDGDTSLSGLTPGAGRSCRSTSTIAGFYSPAGFSWRKPEGRTPPAC
jgi:hypothetical protein